MALLEINGVAIPTPTSYEIGVMDLSEAERNANGYLLIERIATKKKITVSYAVMNGTDLSSLMQKLSNTSFSLKYLDPVTNTYVTTQMYCGDRQIGMISFTNNVPLYQNLNFDLVER